MVENFSCYNDNLSRVSVTEQAWRLDGLGEEQVQSVRAIAAMFILFFLLGVPWNSLVIWSILKERLYNQPTTFLLLSLAITDLLFCLLMMPSSIASGIAAEFALGSSDAARCRWCQASFLFTVLIGLSVHTVTLMSVDRFLYLLKPLTYHSIVTPNRMLVVVVMTWALCLVLSLPPLFGFGEISYADSIGTCTVLLLGEGYTPYSRHYTILLLTEGGIVIVVLITVNLGILVIVWKHFRKVKKLCINEKQSNRKVQLYFLKMFGAVMATEILTLLPLIALALTSAVVSFSQIPVGFVAFAYIVYISQSVFHPVVESFLTKNMRSAFLYYFTCASFRQARRKKNATTLRGGGTGGAEGAAA